MNYHYIDEKSAHYEPIEIDGKVFKHIKHADTHCGIPMFYDGELDKKWLPTQPMHDKHSVSQYGSISCRECMRLARERQSPITKEETHEIAEVGLGFLHD